MKKKFIAPIRIDIPDLKKSVSVGNLKIRKITSKELIQYFKISDPKYDSNGDLVGFAVIKPFERYFFLLNNFDLLKLQSCQHVVEHTNQDAIVKELNNLLLSLRLYREGNVFAPLIFHSDLLSLSFIYPRFINETEKFTIHTKEFEKIRKIVKLINKNTNLKLAFERFNNAISTKTNEENSFIDFVTILESIFLNNPGKHELSFTFSLYTSFILKNKLKINATFKEMKDIYTVRSQLVHSGKSKKYSKDLYNKTKKYTRCLLLWSLKNSSINDKECENMILKHLKLNP